MKYAISACLCGVKCRYDGKSKPHEEIKEFALKNTTLLFCPESLGGLPIPRKGCEIVGNKVVNEDGEDFSNEFFLGANKALKMIKENKIDVVIMKENSPSCGVNFIHNGKFDKGLIKGMGITTRLLKKEGFIVISEEEYEKGRCR